MASREFTITELVSEVDSQEAGGVLNPYSGVRFVFTAREHNAPVGGWKFGGQLVTKREDYPGTDEPVEQVLVAKFEPFTLRGTWDDKWTGAGYADRTWKAFEQLCRRGRMCQFALEGVAAIGLITDWEFDYRRKTRVGYQFTVSPHRRGGETGDAGRWVRRSSSDVQAPKDYVKRVTALLELLRAAHVQIPSLALSGSVLADSDVAVEAVAASVAAVETSIDNRLRLSAPVDGAQRVVQAFTSLRGTSAALATLARSFGPTALAYEAAGPVMGLDVWTKGLATAALQLAYAADVATRDLQRRIGPSALALYAPQAGESLYAISNRYFGTPHRWRDIQARNNLSHLILDGTELLVIPASR